MAFISAFTRTSLRFAVPVAGLLLLGGCARGNVGMAAFNAPSNTAQTDASPGVRGMPQYMEVGNQLHGFGPTFGGNTNGAGVDTNGAGVDTSATASLNTAARGANVDGS